MPLLVLLALAHAQTVVLEHRIPTTTQVGLAAAAVGGVDRWQDGTTAVDGGGPSAEARFSMGAGYGWKRSQLSAGYGGLAQGWLDPSVVDGHLAQLGLTRTGGLGTRLATRGSVAQRWTEASLAVGVYRKRVQLQVAPLVRAGDDPTTPGGFAELALTATPGDRLELSTSLRATAHLGELLPQVGVVRGSITWDPTLSVELGLGGSALAALGGDPVSRLGLPPGDSQLARGEAWLVAWLTRGFALQAESAAELGLGSAPYQRLRVFAGLRFQLGRIRTSSTETPAGTVRFVLDRPDASSVALAGSFTGWEPVAMSPGPTGWTVEIPLAPGIHEYVYLVDGLPVVPPEAASTREDGFGGRNAVLVVGDPAM